MGMNPNDRRALEGEAQVLLGADALHNDPITACVDAVANIMHFAQSLGMDPQLLVERGQTTYQGDMEDGPKAAQILDPAVAESELFQPRAEAVEMLQARLAQAS